MKREYMFKAISEANAVNFMLACGTLPNVA
jgi:hypothetical protein